MTTSEHVSDLLPDFLMGSFQDEERNRIQSHLQSCAECSQEFESLSTLWHSLGELPQEKPSVAMRQRFQAMLAAYEQGIRHGGASWLPILNGWVERVWPKQPAFQFGLALVLFLLGGVIGTRMDSGIGNFADRKSERELAQLQGEVRAMTRMLTVSLLQQQSASERLRGVSMSYRIEGDQEMTGTLLNTLKYDGSPNVRLAALEALTRMIDQDRVRKELVQMLPKQSSPMVQVAMVDLVIQMQDTESKSALEKLIQDPMLDKTVKKRAEQGIKQIL